LSMRNYVVFLLMASSSATHTLAQDRIPKITVACQPDSNPEIGMVCDYVAGETRFTVVAVGHRLGSAVAVDSVRRGDRVQVNASYTAVSRKTPSGVLTRYVCHKTGGIADSAADCQTALVRWD
jgi:hypothetical protein